MSFTFPPHLPPPSCDVARHRQWQRMKTLFVAGFFGLAAGLSGAAVMLGWIWPGFGGGNVWFANYNRHGVLREELEARVHEELSERVVTVYKGGIGKDGSGFLSAANKVGEAIIVSSDGWLALYFPSFDGNVKNISVLAADNKIYPLEKGMLDRYSGIAYLKIKDGQFKVVSFADDNQAPDELSTYGGAGAWVNGNASRERVGSFAIPHLETSPVVSYVVDNNVPAASVALNSQGRIVGLTKNNNELIPAVYVARLLPAVLGRGEVSYLTLGAEGWFDEEQPIFINGRRVHAFYASKIINKASLSRKGDIILEFNGKVAKAGDLWYNNAQDKVRLKVWREGKAIEFESPVYEIRM